MSVRYSRTRSSSSRSTRLVATQCLSGVEALDGPGSTRGGVPEWQVPDDVSRRVGVAAAGRRPDPSMTGRGRRSARLDLPARSDLTIPLASSGTEGQNGRIAAGQDVRPWRAARGLAL